MDNEKADRIIGLLEEIKKGQEKHNEDYQEALRNQAESIKRQSEAIALQKKVTGRLPLLLIAAFVLIGVLYFLLRH